MLYKLFVFLIFLSPLVFIHEFGHYFFARLAGIRVEIFSIGFGKKLFSFIKGDTEYRFSLIPLGGFVKLYGDDPLKRDEIPENEREFAFNHKSKWSRFLVVFGGPLANFIMAFVLFYTLVFKGELVTPFQVGKLKSNSQLALEGFKTGDKLLSLNGQELYSQEDFIFLNDDINDFVVDRAGNKVKLQSKLASEAFIKSFFLETETLIDSLVVDKDLNKFFISSSENNLIKKSLQENLQGSKNLSLFNDKNEYLKKLQVKEGKLQEAYYSHGLIAKNVIKDSPAFKSGLQKNDLIIGTTDFNFYYFNDLRTYIQKNKTSEINFKVYRKGELINIKISPLEKTTNSGIVFYSIGVESSVKPYETQKVEIASKGFFPSFKIAWSRTINTMYKTLMGLMKMFSSKTALNSVGGPVAIANVATDSLNLGLEHFFRLMAIISINLGLINLFPIPVLDGGHILFLVFEFFNGGPLSKKKMGIAQQFGLSLLFLLIAIALFNDITRYLV